jgi:hypothetical protein
MEWLILSFGNPVHLAFLKAQLSPTGANSTYQDAQSPSPIQSQGKRQQASTRIPASGHGISRRTREAYLFLPHSCDQAASSSLSITNLSEKVCVLGYFASKEPPQRTLEFLTYIEIALNKCLKLNLASFFLFARV